MGDPMLEGEAGQFGAVDGGGRHQRRPGGNGGENHLQAAERRRLVGEQPARVGALVAAHPSDQPGEILAHQLGLAGGAGGGDQHGESLGIDRNSRPQPHQLPILGDLDAGAGEAGHGAAQQHQLDPDALGRDQRGEQSRHRAGGDGDAAAQRQFRPELFGKGVDARPIVGLSLLDDLEGRIDPSRHDHKKLPSPRPGHRRGQKSAAAEPRRCKDPIYFMALSAGTECAHPAGNSAASSFPPAGSRWPATHRHSGWRRAGQG